MNHIIDELIVAEQIDIGYENILSITELVNSIANAGYGEEMEELFGERLRLLGIDTTKPLKDQLYNIEVSDENLGVAIAIELVVEILFNAGQIIYTNKTNKKLVTKKKLEIVHREDYDVTYANEKVKAYSYQETLETLQKGLPVMQKIFELSVNDLGLSTITGLIEDIDGSLVDGEFTPPKVSYVSATLKEHGWNSDTLEEIHPLIVATARMLRVLATHIRQMSKNAKPNKTSNVGSIVELRKLTTFLLPFASRCVIKHITIVKMSKRNYLFNT